MEYQLLSPEEEIEEIYPYRRVWQALILEMGILLAVVAGIVLITRLGIIDNTYSREISVILCLLPIGTFTLITIRREVAVLQPRQGLLMVLILSVIVTNGVAWTITEYLITPDKWLNQIGFFSRILGYMLTSGVLAAFIIYAILRYTIWPEHIRIRIDGVAYSVPIALGYALVFNLHFVLSQEPTLSAMAIRILTTVYLHIVIGALMSYFLAELTIGTVPFYWLPMGLAITAFLSGVFIAFRRVATVSGLGTRDIGGLLLVIGFTAVVLGALAFLIENADTRMAARIGAKRVR